ncbi:MAG: pyruvate kinase [Tissierella sp.]|uniref:pyruvate kinase n=1 Tax=Tissierella sp. TaxID=41274 RepID=UPI003F9C61C3
MKKTKIVATIGPASESEEILRELFKNGLNVCRLNFSHGNHEEHKIRIETIKKVREELGLPIGIMLDTKGPEIRLGDFRDGAINLSQGDHFTLTTRDILGDKTIVNISYEGLPGDIEVGNMILIDDGLVELEVLAIKDTEIECVALNNGELSNHKGVNVPHVEINLPAITEKDRQDIVFGIENDIDFIAASFIRKAEDVTNIRKILEENNGENIGIISKIENQQGVDNIEEILKASDGMMVARGDLGVETETEVMPLVQKDLIKRANNHGKPVITATQMLDSMMRNPRPTRAEVTDVANAIFDGTSAIMLSGETAAGKYPVDSVKTMYNIALKTEEALDYREILKSRVNESETTTTNAISRATCYTAQDLRAEAIITATSSGHTSKSISKFKPRTPIIAATNTKRVMRRLSLVWGVYPVLAPTSSTTDEVVSNSVEAAIEGGYVKEGDLIVITAGVPVGLSGTTNLIKVHTIGKVLVTGTGIGSKSVVGKARVYNNGEDFSKKFKEGDILVANSTDKDMMSFIEKASAIVTEHGGLTSHGAIVGLNFEIPTIVGAKDATSILKDGGIVTIDSATGQIYEGEARVL